MEGIFKYKSVWKNLIFMNFIGNSFYNRSFITFCIGFLAKLVVSERGEYSRRSWGVFRSYRYGDGR